MARVRAVMMQRDEDALLEPWLRWHGALFGPRNLVVLDNGSRLPAVLDILRAAEADGVSVIRGHDSPRDFLDKGLHAEAVIRRFDADGDYDFALPLDCDEFLAVFTPDGLSCEPDDVHAALDALRPVRSALGIEMSLTNVPGRPGWFVADTLEKGFLPACSVLDVDHGFHRPRSRLAEGTRWTPLCFLHFHNKPFEVLREHARRKLDGLVDVDDQDALRRYDGINNHLVPYFMLTPEQFAAIPERLLRARLPAFDRRAQALGIEQMLDWPLRPAEWSMQWALSGPPEADGLLVQSPGAAPVRFDPAAYLDRYPDVAAAAAMPLQHFLRHGWREGRSPGG
ncbi:glycosyltransferase family 2 protein [Rhizosaccharibacter radicis]|uniref:Glycosyltransferase family 2 protein n=1 Tax=Rhizosaccharibacter radicis TaxID=2782605 RepID=A0ABT1W0A0_9PROT|nr:glycosyltransferase family 2 protein [Acetobacteraceae bacterium KSS12]